MRRIPTTSLRSTLLALLLTLCLALPALAAQKEGLLLVAFGTSVPEAQPALTAIDKEFKAAFPHSPVIWAYTSSIIRAKLEKKGVHIGDVAAGLEELARQKVDVVRVQSLHVVAGEEFSEMERLLVSWLVRHPDSFKAVYLGRPLLESLALDPRPAYLEGKDCPYGFAYAGFDVRFYVKDGLLTVFDILPE